MSRFQVLIYEDEKHPPVVVSDACPVTFQEAKSFAGQIWMRLVAHIVSVWDTQLKEFRWMYTKQCPEGYSPSQERLNRMLITR